MMCMSVPIFLACDMPPVAGGTPISSQLFGASMSNLPPSLSSPVDYGQCLTLGISLFVAALFHGFLLTISALILRVCPISNLIKSHVVSVRRSHPNALGVNFMLCLVKCSATPSISADERNP